MNLQQLSKPIKLPKFTIPYKKPGSKNARLKIALSLDIGSFITKMAVTRQKANTLSVEQAFSTYTPPGASEDGGISDPASLAAMLRQLTAMDQTQSKDLIFSIESTRIIKREFIIPKIPDADIPGLITYEMGQYLPIDVSEYSIQPKVIGRVTEDGDEKIRVSVNAVPKSMIQSYQSLFTAVGLKPVSMGIHPDSVEKLIRFDIQNNKASEFANRNVVFIDMGHKRFSVSAYEGGLCQFSRDIEIGGGSIDNMLMDVLRVSADDARNIKYDICGQINATDLERKFGSLPTGYQPQTVNEKALISLLSILNRWTAQIEDVLQYMTRIKSSNIDRVYLYGGGSLIKGIGGFLENKLGVGVSSANNIKCCEFAHGVNGQVTPITHLNAIGAAIRL